MTDNVYKISLSSRLLTVFQGSSTQPAVLPQWLPCSGCNIYHLTVYCCILLTDFIPAINCRLMAHWQLTFTNAAACLRLINYWETILSLSRILHVRTSQKRNYCIGSFKSIPHRPTAYFKVPSNWTHQETFWQEAILSALMYLLFKFEIVG